MITKMQLVIAENAEFAEVIRTKNRRLRSTLRARSHDHRAEDSHDRDVKIIHPQKRVQRIEATQEQYVPSLHFGKTFLGRKSLPLANLGMRSQSSDIWAHYLPS